MSDSDLRDKNTMDELDESYEIRLASKEDIDNIMQFIDKYWKKGHIMGRDREYFEYEFVEGDQVNFILAIDRSSGKIEALNGFLKASQDREKKDIWGSIWLSLNSDERSKKLGIELIRRKPILTNCRYSLGTGDNPRTAVPLLRLFLKKKTTKMKQYYMLNACLEEFRIAVILNKPQLPTLLQEKELFRISHFEELRASFDINDNENIPYKDEWYVEKKFFNNPRRNYISYAIRSRDAEKFDAFFVVREEVIGESKAVRILDYYGDHEALASVGGRLQQWLQENQYEYVDFYHLGFDESILSKAGFTMRTDVDMNIIPNYFSPFEQKNIDIWVSYDSEGTVFFKADGDQDRANG